MTLQDCFNWYEDDAKNRNKKSLYQAQYIFKKYLTALHARKLVDILPADVITITNKLIKVKNPRYVQANRVVEILSRLYNFANKRLGYKCDNPTIHYEKHREAPSDRFMDEETFKKFLEAVKKEPDRDARHLFLILIYCGVRSSNACSVRFSEINFDEKTWRIPALKSKNGREMVLSLNDRTLEVFKERREFVRGDIVFPTKKNSYSGTMWKPHRQFARICKSAGISGYCVHSIRKSYGAFAINTLKLPIAEVSKLLCHSSVRITENHYARLERKTLSEASNRIANAIG